jgi:hypothetical protein
MSCWDKVDAINEHVITTQMNGFKKLAAPPDHPPSFTWHQDKLLKKKVNRIRKNRFGKEAVLWWTSQLL